MKMVLSLRSSSFRLVLSMNDIQLVLKFSDFITLKLQELGIESSEDVLDEEEIEAISIDFGHPFTFEEQSLEFLLNDGTLISLIPVYSGELGTILYGFVDEYTEVRFYNPKGFVENDFESAFKLFFNK